MTGTTLDELRHQLARAEQEFVCAEYIDNADRMYRERERWAAEITRLRLEIQRDQWADEVERPKEEGLAR